MKFEDCKKTTGTGRLKVPYCYELLRSILPSHFEDFHEYLSECGGHLTLQQPPPQDKTTEPQDLLTDTDSLDTHTHTHQTYPYTQSTQTHQTDKQTSSTHTHTQNRSTDPPQKRVRLPPKSLRMEKLMQEAFQEATSHYQRIEEQNIKLLETREEGFNLVSRLIAAIERSNDLAEARNKILRERNEILRQYYTSKP